MRITALLASAIGTLLVAATAAQAAKPARAASASASGSAPTANASANARPGAAAASAAIPAPAARPAAKVDINSATEAALMQALDVDARTARSIVKNRPYEAPDDLVTRLVFNNRDFKLIKDKVTVGPAGRTP